MITIHKLYPNGKEKYVYHGEVTERTPTQCVVHAIYHSPRAELEYVTLKPGDVFLEYYFTDRWYNFFEIFEGATFKGWYCNIARPATFEGDHIYYIDLALDYFVQPNGHEFILDEDEFAELNLPPTETASARAALGDLRNLVARRLPPFHRLP